MTDLVYKGVSKVFVNGARHVHALMDIDLTVSRGEFISIVGPSGCGKSTLLRMAAGLELPTAGTSEYRGEAIRGPDRRRGLVFQSYSVFPWLTVERNLTFGLRDRNSADVMRIARRWLEFTGLTDFAGHYPRDLSGGMRQRVALARTMACEPELLLLDEAFGALDPPQRLNLQQLVQAAAVETKCTVLSVSHHIREAVFLSDRVVLMSARPGRILKSYDVTDTRPRPRDFLAGSYCTDLSDQILKDFPCQM